MAGLDPKVSFEPAVRKVFTGDETIVIKDGMMTRPKISVATFFFVALTSKMAGDMNFCTLRLVRNSYLLEDRERLTTDCDLLSFL